MLLYNIRFSYKNHCTPQHLTFCLPLSIRLCWAEGSSNSLPDPDFELRAASLALRLPGETERLFDVLAMAERDSEAALSSAISFVAAVTASCAAIAASRCDVKAKAEPLLGSTILLAAVQFHFGRPELTSSPSESDTICPKIFIRFQSNIMICEQFILAPPRRRYWRWKCVWGPAPRPPSVAVPTSFRNRVAAVYKQHSMSESAGWKRPHWKGAERVSKGKASV